MTIQKFNKKRSELIMAIHDMTLEELQQVVDAVKLRRTYLHNMAIRSLRRGNTVKFFSRGSYHQGTVHKVAQKYVTVDTGSTYWKVPAGHLEKVA